MARYVWFMFTQNFLCAISDDASKLCGIFIIKYSKVTIQDSNPNATTSIKVAAAFVMILSFIVRDLIFIKSFSLRLSKAKTRWKLIHFPFVMKIFNFVLIKKGNFSEQRKNGWKIYANNSWSSSSNWKHRDIKLAIEILFLCLPLMSW